MKKQPIKIIYGKLGQYKSDGLAFTEDRVIMIDNRLRGQRELETIIHEVIHVQNPKWPEIMVEGKAKELAEILWQLHYRKVDN
jgi:hypothetical protein